MGGFPDHRPGDEREKVMLLEAGAQLAAAGGNQRSLAFFGLRWMHHAQWESSLTKISDWGLPVMTSPDAEQLRENDHIISVSLPRGSSPQRRFLLLFDRTYLSTGMPLAQTSQGQVLCGGVHRPPGFVGGDQAQIKLQRDQGPQQFKTSELTKANEVESCVVIDVTRAKGPIYETAAFPVTSAALRHELLEDLVISSKKKRGQYETLFRLGLVLSNSPSVKYIMCDGHGSHDMLRKACLGFRLDLPRQLEEITPFFSQLQVHDLPKVCFPIGSRYVSFEGDSIHWFAGPQHLAKNLCEQVRGVLRTVHYGNKFVDFSGGMDLGLWPAAFVGHDTMSDWQAALLLLGQV